MSTAEPDAPAVARWGFSDVAITLVGTIVLGVVVILITDPLRRQGGQAEAWVILALLIVPWLCLGGWPIYAARTRGNGPRIDYGLTLTWRTFGVGVLGGLVALVLASLVAAVTERISGQFDSAVGDLAIAMATSPIQLSILALCTAFGAPIVEELAFRGLVFGSFLRFGVSTLVSVVATAALFAGFHFEGIRLPLLLTIGLVLGTVRAITKSTAASIVSHMVVNIPGAIGMLLLLR